MQPKTFFVSTFAFRASLIPSRPSVSPTKLLLIALRSPLLIQRNVSARVALLVVFFCWWFFGAARRHAFARVDGVCALLGTVCATRCCVRGWVVCVCGSTLCVRLGAVCATRTLLSIFFASLQRDTDVVFPCRSNSRLLLARRCYGSSDEPGRHCCVEPNVDWSWLLAVVGLQETGFQLQHCCCSLQCQWFGN